MYTYNDIIISRLHYITLSLPRSFAEPSEGGCRRDDTWPVLRSSIIYNNICVYVYMYICTTIMCVYIIIYIYMPITIIIHYIYIYIHIYVSLLLL